MGHCVTPDNGVFKEAPSSSVKISLKLHGNLPKKTGLNMKKQSNHHHLSKFVQNMMIVSHTKTKHQTSGWWFQPL